MIAVVAAAAAALRFFVRRPQTKADSEEAYPAQAKPNASAAERGSGSAFPAEVPAEASRTTAPSEAALAAAQPAASCATSDGKPLILVAEDNPSNYRLVEVLLHNDYALLHAETGLEAIALFRRHRPALILMDISMPEMDGYEALKGVRALDAKVPVIALTARAFETDRQQMKECGFNGSLAKPLDARELKRAIRRELELDDPDSNRRQ